MTDPTSGVTELLAGLDERGGGRERSLELLMPLVYDELRRLAGRALAGERRAVTLQPTALVHEAFLRLVDQTRVSWQGRTHFFAVAATMMRRVLIDHARSRARAKRGGGLERVTLATGDEPAVVEVLDAETLLDVDSALERLAVVDPREARVVELRVFAGLSNEEIAAHLGVSLRTVVGDWAHARAWLRRELERVDAQ